MSKVTLGLILIIHKCYKIISTDKAHKPYKDVGVTLIIFPASIQKEATIIKCNDYNELLCFLNVDTSLWSMRMKGIEFGSLCNNKPQVEFK